ncbi:MAG: c-type cytochrome [Gammaproteobacteria bacterium]
MIRTTMMILGFGLSASAHAADLARAETIVSQTCHLCHGKDGENSNAVYPRLAGQNAAYIAKQLGDFKNGRRKGTMTAMVTDLNEAEMVALGKYFSSKPTKAHRVSEPELAAVGQYLYHNGNKWSGLASCASCHGAEAAGSETLPRLAGQHARYLVTQLKDFNTRERTNDNAVMHSIASKLTEFEVEALARYLSGK